jgi:hypothetical protein
MNVKYKFILKKILTNYKRLNKNYKNINKL